MPPAFSAGDGRADGFADRTAFVSRIDPEGEVINGFACVRAIEKIDVRRIGGGDVFAFGNVERHGDLGNI